MQLAREHSPANVIRAWEAGRVRVGEQWLNGNLIVAWDKILPDWAVSDPGTIDLNDLEPAIELEPEIILLGTGAEMRLPDVQLMASLAERTIGLEIMTTPSACRTFNVLVHEERRVVAALINSRPTP